MIRPGLGLGSLLVRFFPSSFSSLLSRPRSAHAFLFFFLIIFFSFFSRAFLAAPAWKSSMGSCGLA
jgi:hypothetical protein